MTRLIRLSARLSETGPGWVYLWTVPTAGQDARFHRVADEFGRPERRQVRKVVLAGDPPIGTPLEPLARAYADHLAWTVGTVRPTRAMNLQVLAGIVWTACGVLDLVVTAETWLGVGFVVLGLIYCAMAISSRPREQKLLDGLRRSRVLFGLPPLERDRTRNVPDPTSLA